MTEYWDKPVKRYCGNCGNLILGYKTAEGIVKIQSCPRRQKEEKRNKRRNDKRLATVF